MTVLDSAAALLRARAQIGQPDGAGQCLANVYRWFGSVQSTGPGAGQYDVALKGWTFAASKLYPMEIAPAGVPVWFDVSPTRTDRNKTAGDVGLSIGGGYGIFTDSPTGNTGIMSFVDRSIQIQRPPLGFTTDFLGHDTSAGLAWLDNTAGAPVIVNKPIIVQAAQEDTMTVRIVKDSASDALNLVNLVTGVRKPISSIDDARDLGTLVNGTGRLGPARIDQLNAQYLRPAGPIGAANVVSQAEKSGQVK